MIPFRLKQFKNKLLSQAKLCNMLTLKIIDLIDAILFYVGKNYAQFLLNQKNTLNEAWVSFKGNCSLEDKPLSTLYFN